MNRLRAKMQNGSLPLNDNGDNLTDEQREALHQALARSLDSLKKGRTSPAYPLLDQLRTRR
jgi:hypothetical protein